MAVETLLQPLHVGALIALAQEFPRQGGQVSGPLGDFGTRLPQVWGSHHPVDQQGALRLEFPHRLLGFRSEEAVEAAQRHGVDGTAGVEKVLQVEGLGVAGAPAQNGDAPG